MGKNGRNFPKNDDEKLKETIKLLKARLKTLQKDNDKLRSENKTLQSAWQKTEEFLSEATEGMPLDELIKKQKLPKSALKTKAPEKKVDSTEDARLKWKKWREENL